MIQLRPHTLYVFGASCMYCLTPPPSTAGATDPFWPAVDRPRHHLGSDILDSPGLTTRGIQNSGL